MSPVLPAARIHRGSLALAWRLAVVGVAVGMLLSSAVGRNGCLRHGGFGGAVAAATFDGAPEHADTAHATCPVCAASAIGAATTVATAVVAAAPHEITGIDRVPELAAPPGDAPLVYAPKTSPPQG